LRNRGISALHDVATLRFHPCCYYRPDADAPTEVWPALIAAVTDLAGSITGAHRTWLDPSGEHKAPIDTPRRAMGHLLGHGVRFGFVTDVMAAGEGIEIGTLTERARAAGIEVLTLSPTLGDFNEGLRLLGVDHLRAALRLQLASEDVPRFLSSTDGSGSGR
jgi:hypothetical protein